MKQKTVPKMLPTDFHDSLPKIALTSEGKDVAIFQQIEDYAWDSDPEFQRGLQAILGSSPSTEQAEHLTLRARCFYFTRYGFLHASNNLCEN